MQGTEDVHQLQRYVARCIVPLQANAIRRQYVCCFENCRNLFKQVYDI